MYMLHLNIHFQAGSFWWKNPSISESRWRMVALGLPSCGMCCRVASKGVAVFLPPSIARRLRCRGCLCQFPGVVIPGIPEKCTPFPTQACVQICSMQQVFAEIRENPCWHQVRRIQWFDMENITLKGTWTSCSYWLYTWPFFWADENGQLVASRFYAGRPSDEARPVRKELSMSRLAAVVQVGTFHRYAVILAPAWSWKQEAGKYGDLDDALKAKSSFAAMALIALLLQWLKRVACRGSAMADCWSRGSVRKHCYIQTTVFWNIGTCGLCQLILNSLETTSIFQEEKSGGKWRSPPGQ